MPGIVRKSNQVPTAIGVDTSRAQSNNLLLSRGAFVLLILLLLVIGLALVQWRTSEAQRMAMLTANTHPHSYQSTLPIKQEENTTMQSTELNGPNVTSDVQVNGKSIDVPVNGGTVHEETVSNDGTKTTVEVKLDSSTSGSSVQGQSTFNLNVKSDQVSESEKE